MRAAARRAGRIVAPLPPAWFLTDAIRTPDPLDVMERLPPGWGVVYRHFGATDRFDRAKAMVKAARKRRLVFLASYDPDLLSLDLDGVHWPRWARDFKRRGHGRGLQTTSAHDHRQIASAALRGFDACFTSSVFPSRSPSAPTPIGLQRFRQLQLGAPVSLIALGGVDSRTVGAISRTSAFASVEGAVLAFGRRGEF